MTTYIIIGVVVLLLLLLFFTGYLKAPPDTAYIISGLGRKRILIGKAGWRVPFFERVDKLSLRVMQVDVRTSEAVPTNEFINVSVDGVANVKVSSDPELLQLAAEALLGKRPEELVSLVTQVMEGNMREIVGSVGLKEMVQDRQGVARKITENVVPDMRKLGLEVVNFNIQNFKDGAGTIENMGIDNVEQIRKNAQIAKANAQRDIAIATAQAEQDGVLVSAYATDASWASVIEGLCRKNHIPFRKFSNRSDIRGGSTLGSISSALLNMPTVDAGVPILAMHSSREVMHINDQEALEELTRVFFS